MSNPFHLQYVATNFRKIINLVIESIYKVKGADFIPVNNNKNGSNRKYY